MSYAEELDCQGGCGTSAFRGGSSRLFDYLARGSADVEGDRLMTGVLERTQDIFRYDTVFANFICTDYTVAARSEAQKTDFVISAQ